MEFKINLTVVLTLWLLEWSWNCAKISAAGKAKLDVEVAKSVCSQTQAFFGRKELQPPLSHHSMRPDVSKVPCKAVRWSRCESEGGSCSKFKWTQCGAEDKNGSDKRSEVDKEPKVDGGSRAGGAENPSQIGKDALRNEFPYLVRILDNSTDNVLCTGALISDLTVVTTASCLNGIPPEQLLVVAGDWDSGKLDESEQVRNVSYVTYHQHFDCFTHTHDIAMLNVTQRFIFDQGLSAVRLPSDVQHDMTSVVNCGWEGFDPFCDSQVLKRYDLHLFPHDQCAQAFQGTEFAKIQDNVCTSTPVFNDSVGADFGSPLVYINPDNPKDHLLVGLGIRRHSFVSAARTAARSANKTTSVTVKAATAAFSQGKLAFNTAKGAAAFANKHATVDDIPETQRRAKRATFLKHLMKTDLQTLRRSKRLIGGEDAKPHEFPFLVRIVNRTSLRTLCGGAILNQLDVLTSASCVWGVEPEEIQVTAGERDVLTNAGMEETRWVELIVPQNCYNRELRRSDLALLVLILPFTFNDQVKPLQLPDHTLRANGTAILAGWGSVTGACQPVGAQKVHLPIITDAVCQALQLERGANLTIVEHMLCTGNTDKRIGPCESDLGAPLVQLHDSVFTLVGVASYGIGCLQSSAPPVYTEVAFYVPWITAILSTQEEIDAAIAREQHGEDQIQSSRAFGGFAARKFDFPFQVRLSDKKSRLAFCSGALVSRKVVVTTAECTVGRSKSVMKATLGLQHLKGREFWIQHADISDILMHPNFDPTTKTNNVAALVLEQAVRLTHSVQPAFVMTGTASALSMGDDVQVSGWGRTWNGCRAQTLQHAPLAFMNESLCAQYYEKSGVAVDNSTLCAHGNGTIDDLGAPLTIHRSSGHVLLGILTNVLPSSVEPSLFVDIPKAAHFILSIIQKHEDPSDP